MYVYCAVCYHVIAAPYLIYILMSCVPPRFLGNTPLHDIVVYYLGVELFFVLTYFDSFATLYVLNKNDIPKSSQNNRMSL